MGYTRRSPTTFKFTKGWHKAARKRKKWVDKKRHYTEYKSLRSVHKGLVRRYEGLFPILGKVGKVSYRVELPSRLKIHPVFHVGRYNNLDEHPFFSAQLLEPMFPLLQYPNKSQRKYCDSKDDHSQSYFWRDVKRYYCHKKGHTKSIVVMGNDSSSKAIEIGTVKVKMFDGVVLHPCADSVNLNNKVWNIYFKNLLPRLVKAGDDGNHGSAAVCDTNCLQALSNRIHYGKFVAEAKFLESSDVYEAAIREQDRDKLMALLTYEAVEAAIKKRVEAKAKAFGQEVRNMGEGDDGDDPAYKIKPRLVANLYGYWDHATYQGSSG
uniref:chorismate mutase n=1 Tax=Vitis vinifera TaxID=29760 RepID=A5BB86_VITVI|nr:hypothetical protein VITISV_028903 [Vitis vinifera]